MSQPPSIPPFPTLEPLSESSGMRHIIDETDRELPVYEHILAQLHALYAADPLGNEKARRWIEEIGGHIQYMHANRNAAQKFLDEYGS